jgi:hypothetical protein
MDGRLCVCKKKLPLKCTDQGKRSFRETDDITSSKRIIIKLKMIEWFVFRLITMHFCWKLSINKIKTELLNVQLFFLLEPHPFTE